MRKINYNKSHDFSQLICWPSLCYLFTWSLTNFVLCCLCCFSASAATVVVLVLAASASSTLLPVPLIHSPVLLGRLKDTLTLVVGAAALCCSWLQPTVDWSSSMCLCALVQSQRHCNVIVIVVVVVVVGSPLVMTLIIVLKLNLYHCPAQAQAQIGTQAKTNTRKMLPVQ